MRISASRNCRQVIFAVFIFNCAALVAAQDMGKLQQEIVFHIEKGPLESALIQFSRQAEVQLVLAPDSAMNLTASAVHGQLAASAALTALLKGTGLTYTAVGNTVMVRLSESK